MRSYAVPGLRKSEELSKANNTGCKYELRKSVCCTAVSTEDTDQRVLESEGGVT